MPVASNKRIRAPQMHPKERKKQLLKAGVACAAAKGIDSTKHADLSRACKVSVPTIFTYFPNRNSLVTSILDETGEKLLANIVKPALALSDPTTRLAATGPLFMDFTAREPDYVKVWLMWSMHFAPDIQSRFHKFEAHLVDALAQMIIESSPGKKLDREDVRDRAQVLSISSALLAKMVFDGVSDVRREAFVAHIMSSLMQV
jgi:AcrR family transcriptional regulator